MTSLGFENYAEALKIYLARYREVSIFAKIIRSLFALGVSGSVVIKPWPGVDKILHHEIPQHSTIGHDL